MGFLPWVQRFQSEETIEENINITGAFNINTPKFLIHPINKVEKEVNVSEQTLS